MNIDYKLLAMIYSEYNPDFKPFHEFKKLKEQSDNLKRCSVCEQWVDRSNFNKHKTTLDGLQTKCKPCYKLYAKILRENRLAKKKSE